MGIRAGQDLQLRTLEELNSVWQCYDQDSKRSGPAVQARQLTPDLCPPARTATPPSRPEPATPESLGVPAPERPHPEPYYDAEGRFIHHCWCGAWGMHGFDCEPRHDRLGRWFC